jgi:secreted trypsin-like serine protease
MKAIFLMTAVTLMAATSSAGNLHCKKSSEASGQGYEAVISSNSAAIIFKGQKLADLVKVQAASSAGGDQKAVSQFSQQTVNGYALRLTSGGLAGMTAATILHDGIAGLMPMANLNDCR